MGTEESSVEWKDSVTNPLFKEKGDSTVWETSSSETSGAQNKGMGEDPWQKVEGNCQRKKQPIRFICWNIND